MEKKSNKRQNHSLHSDAFLRLGRKQREVTMYRREKTLTTVSPPEERRRGEEWKRGKE